MSESDPTTTLHGTLKVESPVELPEVLDVFIAGGGPAGTAAAVRCKEFGLHALVIDYDDVMKRIRDYPREKLILPTYGGSDKLQFPEGGEMLAQLHFDPIEGAAMVEEWKQRYRDFGIAARVGSELTGLERGEDGVWTVSTWNHRAGEEFRYRARYVILALGAGVPRRFDIPGNTDGISFRLDSAKDFVGGPALVIGGGTSAAEAVIAVSNAKVEAEDPSHVYWSYRGEKLPKVSKALGDVFFEAYVGNGNIRYQRNSTPVAVVTGPDREEYLSLRVDRKAVPDRPPETVHLEFPKSRVLACIGEDIPIQLLQKLGVKIPMVNGQPRMLVNQDGEVSLPGVFMVGDTRGKRFLRCADFDDSNTYEKVTLNRNIKAAMVDAVAAVEAIARREGREVQAARAPATKSPPKPAPDATKVVEVVPPTPSDVEDARPEPVTGGDPVLVSLRPDGEASEQWRVTKKEFEIGRKAGDLAIEDDVYLADHHATLVLEDGEAFIADTGEGSGVWLRVDGSDGTVLESGAQIWVGAQILVAEQGAGGWQVRHYGPEGNPVGTHPVGAQGLFVGRGSDLVLDPKDNSLSRRHCQLVAADGGLRIFDRGASNGTWVKVDGSVLVPSGAEFKMGTRRFRFEMQSEVEKLAPDEVVEEAPRQPETTLPGSEQPAVPAAAAPASEAPAAAPAAPAADGAVVVQFEHDEFPTSWEVPEGKTILQAFMDQGGTQDEPLGWECKKGRCGLCVVQILEGADQFEPTDPGSGEMKTIQVAEGVEPDPSKYRLCCLARLKGPVKLGLVE